MANVHISKFNEVYLKVDCEPGIAREMQDYFTYEYPGAKFTPQYRARMWDGKIRLYNMMSKQLYVGLLPYVKDFCEQYEYTFEDTVPLIGDPITIDGVLDFAKKMNLHSQGKPIEIRDYQAHAVRKALRFGRTLLLSPTASGKSLIIYLILRYYQMKGFKQLIIVPTTSLVEQMYGDFKDYASQTDWKVSENCAKIYSGFDKTNQWPVTISTWQSLYKLPRSFFNEFDVIYGDEAHLFKAKSLESILNHCVGTKFRIGTTGTLDGSKTHKLVLEGMFGRVNQVTTTKELMDKNQLANLKISCLLLEHSEQDRKAGKNWKYQEEMDFLVKHHKRNIIIRNLALKQTGNTLVLYQYVAKHGDVLYTMIKDKADSNRKIFYVFGGTDAEQREKIRALTELENDAIIVASYGTFSTGINIRNLHNIIFASPSKSRIRNLQSIGRGLRKGDAKADCNLYDIADDLSYKSHKNFTLSHMIERIKIYNEEGFDYSMIKLPLE